MIHLSWLTKKPDIKIGRLYNVITIQLGPDVMLAAKIRLKMNITIDAARKIINDLEKKIKNKYPEIKWSFIGPDIED
jgi:divalent metal cation (Fe/Co/Zn/Cd) transporter